MSALSRYLDPHCPRCLYPLNQDKLGEQMALIRKVVCRETGVRIAVMASQDRSHAVVIPHMLTMWMIRTLTSAPYKAQGKWWGRDHGTIIHACKTTAGTMDVDSDFSARVHEIRTACEKALENLNLENPS